MLFYEALTEINNKIPIYIIGKKVIYSVYVQEIKENSFITLTSEFEATNKYEYNAMIGSNVVLADCAECVEGINIDAPNAFNISPSMHHGVVIKSRQFQSKNNYYNKFINVVAWSSADKAKYGDYLIVEKNYGHLDLLIYENNNGG